MRKPMQTLRPTSLAALALSLSMLGGCATTGPADERDPWEGFNRSMHSFNTTVDDAVFIPVSKGYKKVVPTPINKGITNFFSNINEVLVILNDLLQFKLGNAASDTGRLLVNSTAGIFGVIDVATEMGLDKHDEDFGQTLGYWGMGPGPYLVLPFLGPKTLRDTGGLLVDSWADPVWNIDDMATRNALLALRFLDTRADLLSATSILETAALDQYSFVRDAYLQRRDYLIYDGDPPEPDIQ